MRLLPSKLITLTKPLGSKYIQKARYSELRGYGMIMNFCTIFENAMLPIL